MKKEKKIFFLLCRTNPKKENLPKKEIPQKPPLFHFFFVAGSTPNPQKCRSRSPDSSHRNSSSRSRRELSHSPLRSVLATPRRSESPPNFAIFFFLQVQGVIFGLQGSWALLPLGSLILLSLSFSRSLEFSSLTLRAMMARSSPGLSMPRLPLAPSPPAPLPSPTSPSSSPMLTSLTSPLESSTARRPSCPARSRSRAR